MSWRHRGPMERGTSWIPSQPCGMQMLKSERVTDKCHARGCNLPTAPALLRHPHRTPWVPNGTCQMCIGRYIVHEPYSLGCWQNGSWARVRKQGIAHFRPMDLRTRRKRKLLFLWESGYRWPLDQQRNRNKTKQRILLPALRRGNERRCSRRLLRKSKLLNLRVARVRAASSTFWTTWGLAGMRGRCSRRAGLGVNSAWGGAVLEDAGGRPWRRADWNQWTTYNMILLQLEQTTGLSGRRGTGPPTEPGFSQGFFSILSPMEFWFLATVASGLLSWGHFISSNIINFIAQILFKLNWAGWCHH